MVYAEFIGNLFQLDPRAPQDHARSWGATGWREHFLTNEEVLCNRETHRLNETATEVYRVFGPQMLVAA